MFVDQKKEVRCACTIRPHEEEISACTIVTYKGGKAISQFSLPGKKKPLLLTSGEIGERTNR